MSLEQLETVVAIAEEGAVVRAARRLHLTQPPVTRRLLALEDELGVPLFERLPRGMRPTAEGHRFIEHARQILSAVEQARAEVRAGAGASAEPCGPPPGNRGP